MYYMFPIWSKLVISWILMAYNTKKIPFLKLSF